MNECEQAQHLSISLILVFKTQSAQDVSYNQNQMRRAGTRTDKLHHLLPMTKRSVSLINAGCHLFSLYEAQNDNLLHMIRWINRPPTTCVALLSEQPPALVIYSLHKTGTLNLSALQLPKVSDVFFWHLPLLQLLKCTAAESDSLRWFYVFAAVHDLLMEGAQRLHQVIFSQDTRYLSCGLQTLHGE